MPNDQAGPWHNLDVSRWAPTKQSLNLYAQILGKIRLALSPPQPNWMFTALYLVPRGLTTGSIPCSYSSIECILDVFESAILIYKNDGRSVRIPFVPPRSVYADVTAALQELNVECYISIRPQEVPDTRPLPEDHRVRDYDPAAALRWLQTYTAVADVFERWRSKFFGRNGIQVWWGAFDVALILFSGKPATPPANRGYLMKYDLDAELMNVGLYLGDEKAAPYFYGYIYPQPSSAPSLPIRPASAAWSATLREWVLPYDDFRASTDPEAALRTFIDAVYAHCFDAAGWDADALRYELPSAIASGRK